METYYIAEGTLINALWCDLNRKEIKSEAMYIHIIDSLCCSAETITTLFVNWIYHDTK